MLAHALEKAKIIHAENLVRNPSKKIITDNTTTPFHMAMQMMGHKPVLTKSKCLILTQCPCCRRGHYVKYTKKGSTYFACPFSQNITKEE